MEQEQQLPDVGRRIRALREDRGLSLRLLAERAGLSTNAISKIERGENSPTVASLHKLATALSVPITDLFDPVREQTSILVRRGQRPCSRAEGVRIESLGAGLPGGRLEPFVITLQPGASSGEEPIAHGGEELMFCLEGVVACRIGEQDHRLEAGDSLLFLADQAHHYGNPGTVPSRALCILQATDQEMRISRQLHLMSIEEPQSGEDARSSSS